MASGARTVGARQARGREEGSAGAKLRALITERHRVFVEELWTLFQTTVTQLEEEVRALREENHSHRRQLEEAQRGRAEGEREKEREKETVERREGPRTKATRTAQKPPEPQPDREEEILTENSSDSENEWRKSIQHKEEEKECAVSPEAEPEVVTENSSDSEDETKTSKKENKRPQNDEVQAEPEGPKVLSDPQTENSSESESESEHKETPKTSVSKPEELQKKRNSFPCSICHKSFNYKSILKMHKRSHANGTTFECLECGSSFAMKYRLDRHMEIHKRNQPSSQHSSYDEDMGPPSLELEETENVPMPPDLDAALMKEADFDATDPGKRPQCLQCGKTFSTTSNMRKHIQNIHTKKISFTRKLQKQVGWRHQHLACPACEKRFRFQSELTRHMKSVHLQKKKEEKAPRGFRCDICLKIFRDNAYFQEHVGMHKGEKPYSCSVCNKSFTFRQSYQAHMKQHQ